MLNNRNKSRSNLEQLKTDVTAVFLSLKSKDTPLAAKILAGITVAYALSPIDLIPDFIPLFGYLDDLIILPVLAGLTIRLIPKEVFMRFREEAEALAASEMPKKWYYAVPVLTVWAGILWFVVRLMFYP